MSVMTQAQRLDRCARAAEHCCDSWPTCQRPDWAAKMGMFRTSDVIDDVRRDVVLLADARTSMSDYRLALCLALGRPCDRNGFSH